MLFSLPTIRQLIESRTMRQYIKRHGYGITGSIACGKSTVLRMIKKLGYPTFNADHFSHEITKVGQPGWHALKTMFGREYFDRDGELNRAKLRKLLITPKLGRQAKKRIEKALHPLIDHELQRSVAKLASSSQPEKIFFYEAALIFEKRIAHRFCEVIVIYANPEDQIQWLSSRDRLSPEDAQLMIAAQMPQEDKKKQATRSISSSCSLAELELRVRQLLEDIANHRKSLTS
ncbi:MAG: dephospho-CoA kinase [Proteobacteria bacterium]|nr:dephospho-CoA kinase [Pseudomonadota bacterium]